MKYSKVLILLAVVLVAFGTTFAGNKVVLEPLARPVTPGNSIEKAPDLNLLNWTDDGFEYYLGSGAAGDTMAVWYKGAGACSVYTIESAWFDGDGNATVLFYVWEISDDPMLGDPGWASDDWGGVSPIGDVVAGPIPFAPTASQDWQAINLADFGIVPFFGDITGTPGAFMVGFVKQDAVPHPLADDEGARGYVYSWFGGPWTSNAWGDYNPIIEYAMRVWVSYPYGAKPSVGNISAVPNTYDGGQDFSVTANITDEGTVVDAKLHWAVNGMTPTDSVAMSVLSDPTYSGTFNPAANVGDMVYYWVSAKDNDGKYTIENTLAPNYFEVVAPMNPNADVLVVDDGAAFDTYFFTDMLDTMGLTYEMWDVAANRGLDASVTTYGWSNAVVFGWGTTTVPSSEYDADNPWAQFLTNGNGLFYCDQDYFYTNNEPASPTFAAGDFAYDFFGITDGENDPAEDADTLVIGVTDDPITGFADGDFVPMRPADFGVGNWVDYITAGIGDFIWTAESGNDVAFRYDGGTFKTVSVLFAVEALNDTTVLDSPRVYNPTYTTFMKNAFTWLGFGTGIQEVDNGVVPSVFSLEQNYPNPFNPVTNMTYNIPKAADVSLTVYSLTGEKIATLVNGNRPAGSYTVTWDGTNNSGAKVSSGIYIYTINAGDYTATKKMVLVK